MTQTVPEPTAQAETGLWNRLVTMLAYGTSLPRRKRLMVYLLVALIALAAIWTPIGLVLHLMPASYTSHWALILPGAGAGHAVSLESVGQASATASSPYNSNSVDPRVNYQAIAQSTPVLSSAARQLNMSIEEFGKPRIKLVDQTALMKFRVSAGSAVLAHTKSTALHEALLSELDRLRSDEFVRREAGINAMLEGVSEKLSEAQRQMIEYQSSARIVSLEQFSELTLSVERMRSDLRQLNAERMALNGRLEAIQERLGMTPEQAIALLDLQNDRLFSSLMNSWSEAFTELRLAESRWGRKNTKVTAPLEQERALRNSMAKRARLLAPTLPFNTHRLLARSAADTATANNFLDLVAEARGMANQVHILEQNIEKQTAQIEQSAKEASRLEDLKRKQQVATAVFTTALAKVDIGKSDRFSSYPLVQMLAKPTLPEKQDTLARNLALVGGGAASLFSLFGLLLLWIRKPFIQKLLKSA